MADQSVELSLAEVLRAFAATLQATRADVSRASGSAVRLNEERVALEQRLAALSARVDQLASLPRGAATVFSGRRMADGSTVFSLAGAEFRLSSDGTLQF